MDLELKMILRLLASIYTAGETFDEAKIKIRGLLNRGFSITSDILGEFADDPDKIESAVSEYKEHIKILGDWRNYKKGAFSIAIKPSRIGFEIGQQMFGENLEEILVCAKKFNIFVWVDAEKRSDRDAVLDAVLKLHGEEYANIGLALQSAHSDASKFLGKLLEAGTPVRLVKGAYNDGDLKSKREIDKNFEELFLDAAYNHRRRKSRTLIAIGTHDNELIDLALDFEYNFDTPIQIQMLYGIRTKLQQKLIAEGRNVLIYVPWGPDAAGFLKRRLCEGIRPGAIWLFLRNIAEARRNQ